MLRSSKHFEIAVSWKSFGISIFASTYVYEGVTLTLFMTSGHYFLHTVKLSHFNRVFTPRYETNPNDQR